MEIVTRNTTILYVCATVRDATLQKMMLRNGY